MSNTNQQSTEYDGSGSLGLDQSQFSTQQQSRGGGGPGAGDFVDPDIRHPAQADYRGALPILGKAVGGDQYDAGTTQQGTTGLGGARGGQEYAQSGESGQDYSVAGARGQQSVTGLGQGAGGRGLDSSYDNTTRSRDFPSSSAGANSAAAIDAVDRSNNDGLGAGIGNEERIRHRQAGDSAQEPGEAYTKSGIGRTGEGLGATEYNNTDKVTASSDYTSPQHATGHSSHSGAALGAAGLAAGAGAGYAGSRYIDDDDSTARSTAQQGQHTSIIGQTGGSDYGSRSSTGYDAYASRSLGSTAQQGHQTNIAGRTGGSNYDSRANTSTDTNAPTSLSSISSPADAQKGLENLSLKHTDQEGFTDLTAGQGRDTDDAFLTGRVKGVDERVRGTGEGGRGEGGAVVVETTSQRSERDAQGRELDSYGKPYDL